MPLASEAAQLRRQLRTPARRRLGMALGVVVLAGIAAVGWRIGNLAQRPDVAAPAPAPAPAPPAPQPQPAPPAAADGVSGSVLLPDGKPAAGARVTLYRARSGWPEWDTQFLEQVTTSFQGEFRLREPRGPDLLVGCELDGFAGVLVEAPALLPWLSLRLRPGHTLTGFVGNGAGQPQPGARVALEPLLGDDRRTVIASTGADGRFRFVDVAAGNVRLVARHPGWQPVALPVSIGAQATAELQFARPAVLLRGRVLTAGQPQRPIASAQVRAWPQVANAGLLDPTMMLTDADGDFELAGLGRGNHRIEVRHAEFSTFTTTLALGSNPPLQQFELVPRSHVAGQLGGSGVPASATLLLRARSGELARAPIGPDGSFDFAEPMPVGWATLEFSNSCWAFARSGTAALQVRVEEQARTELRLEVAPPSRIEGRIVSRAGAPIAGARIYAMPSEQLAAALRETGSALLDIDLRRLGSQLARATLPTPERLLAVSDADGRWQLPGQAAGGLVLRVDHPEFASARLDVQVLPPPSVTELPPLVLAKGLSLRGRISRGGRPLAGAQVSIGSDPPVQAVSGVDGRYELPELPPGSYRLRARFSTLPPLWREVELNTGTGDCDFGFPPGRIVRGSVLAADGQPVEGALVMVRGLAGTPTVTDAGGEFAVELPERPVELQVFLGDRNALTRQLVAASDKQVDIRLDLPPTTLLRARVFTLPGRAHPQSVLLKWQPLGAGDDAEAQTRLVELANGELRYPWLPAQPGRLRLWCEGQAPFLVDVAEPQKGAELQLADVLLEPGCTLQARVVDGAGAPVPGCAAFLGDEADLELFTPQTRSDADGRFTVTGVCSAARRLVVRAQGFAPRTLELQLPGDVLRDEPLPVVLERGASIEVSVAGAGGGFVLLRQKERVVGSAELDADGRAVFGNRAAGSYVVVLAGEGRRAAVEVPASGGVVAVVVP